MCMPVVGVELCSYMERSLVLGLIQLRNLYLCMYAMLCACIGTRTGLKEVTWMGQYRILVLPICTGVAMFLHFHPSTRKHLCCKAPQGGATSVDILSHHHMPLTVHPEQAQRFLEMVRIFSTKTPCRNSHGETRALHAVPACLCSWKTE